MHELVHPEDRAGLKEAILNAVETGQVREYEARFQNHRKNYVWLATSAKLLRNDTDQPQSLICCSHDITGRKRAEDRMHLLAQHLETVREDERTHLSRELHDDIGQILTALKIDLAVVKEGCTCSGVIKKKMADMQKLLSDGIHSVHSLCRRLRPGALDDLGLGEALAGLSDDWKRRNAIACGLCIDANDEPLTDEIKTTIFRFVQEALTNISRHAFASSVEINLVADEQSLHVSIADDGCGMDAGAESKPAAFGLLGMRERFEALGGSLCIESAPGQGTRIEGTVPLEQNR
jgi:signal transduction histidine kinase